VSVRLAKRHSFGWKFTVIKRKDTMQSLAQKYLDMLDQYDMDREDALAEILKVLEKVAPEALQAEIENVEEYLSEFDGQPDEAQEWESFDPDC
jgi:disulfide oxidoreductase YuzD